MLGQNAFTRCVHHAICEASCEQRDSDAGRPRRPPAPGEKQHVKSDTSQQTPTRAGHADPPRRAPQAGELEGFRGVLRGHDLQVVQKPEGATRRVCAPRSSTSSSGAPRAESYVSRLRGHHTAAKASRAPRAEGHRFEVRGRHLQEPPRRGKRALRAESPVRGSGATR